MQKITRAMRSAKRPPEFDFLNVLADGVAVGFGQFENPFTNRLASHRVHIEPRRQVFVRSIIRAFRAKIGTFSQAIFARLYEAVWPRGTPFVIRGKLFRQAGQLLSAMTPIVPQTPPLGTKRWSGQAAAYARCRHCRGHDAAGASHIDTKPMPSNRSGRAAAPHAPPTGSSDSHGVVCPRDLPF